MASEKMIADIVAEKREMAAKIRAELSQVPARREDQLLEAESLEREADRLEAAKREREATTEKSSAVGNAAAMREALVQCELFLGNVSRHGHPTLNPGDKCTACDGVDELRGMVVRALSSPPRNCDRSECKDTTSAQFVWAKEDGGKTAYYDWLLAPAGEGGEK